MVDPPFASVDEVIARALPAWRPPPRLTLSEWADEHFYLSAESAAEPGRWKTLPYQKEIMDALTDSSVSFVFVKKSARVGFTKMLNAAIGYSIHQDPCPILLAQPTVEDAKGYSKEEIAPMLRDCPVLAKIIFEDSEEAGPRDSGNTILHKKFPGGVLSMVGANSGTGFRRISRKRAFLDEVDAYPPSAGSDGDQIKLATARTQYYWDRKVVAGSTPLVAKASRIEALFEEGDQRYRYVPCPHCGHMAPLVFREGGEIEGHVMRWPEGKPDEAYFECQANGCVIEHKDKRAMDARGEWRAHNPESEKRSYHIWAAYSYAPNATWADIAREFLEAKDDTQKLRTFVNTALGQTWQERGDAPEWKRLYQLREHYELSMVPVPVLFLTAGVDVQRDRLIWEVVGWGDDRQSWSVDAGVIPGDPSTDAPWLALDELLNRQWPGADGVTRSILMMGIDSGDQTQTVYNWARRHVGRVIACKGVSGAKVLLSQPTAVDIRLSGKRIPRGCKMWPVGSDVAKKELYGWLRLDPPTTESGARHPPGYCHFPEYGEDFFKQLTAEQLVPVRKKGGFISYEWQVIAGRENHQLDCRVYARAAAQLVGLDRIAAARKAKADESKQASAAALPQDAPTAPLAQQQSQPQRPGRTGGWLRGGGRISAGKGWLSRR